MEAQVLYIICTLWQDDFIVCRQNEKIVKRETCNIAKSCENERVMQSCKSPHVDGISE
jgi:hypothetical protein